MKYALLINPLPGATESMSEDELQAVSREYYAIRELPSVIDGAQLQPAATATTLRNDDRGTILTDGPFADTKEVFGGFYIVEAEDLDGALEVARQIPVLRFGGSVEVRAIVQQPASVEQSR